jgi:hypothetical protein
MNDRFASRKEIQMSSGEYQSHVEKSVPLIYRLHHWFFALCLLLAPLTVSLSFATCPVYGNPNCPGSGAASATTVAVAFRDANTLLLQLFFAVTVIATYVYPLSYIVLGRLAMKRSPWLATIGIACGFVGSVVWSLLTDENFWINMLAQLGFDTQFPRFQNAYLANGWVYAMHAGWVIGHLLGYVLLGIALLRARVIPRWAAWLIIVSAPVMGPLSYGTGLGLLQVLGYGMVFVGSIPAALAMLRRRDEEARDFCA